MSRTKGSKNVKKLPQSPKSNTKDTFKASVRVFGKWYHSEGNTVGEAIERLTPEGVSRGVSILSVEFKDKKQEKILLPIQTSRLFSASSLMREAALRHVTERFSL